MLACILLVGVLARTYRIRGVPTDLHWIRQMDTAAIARNFYEGPMSILYPQVDWRGASAGYVESEFQAYTYLVAVLYRLFGAHEFLARALNIVFYALSAVLLFQFVRRLYDPATALWAAAFYTMLPLSLYFTRTIQPDALMCLCSLAALYYFLRWTEQGRCAALALSAASLALAILIKPTCLYLGLPLAYLLYRRDGWRFLRRPLPWAYAIAAIVPAFLWYWHARGLWDDYGNTLFRGYVGVEFPSLTDPKWFSLAKRFVRAIATPPGVLFVCVGLTLRPPRGNYLLHWWTVGFVVSVYLSLDPQWGHNYYQLPLVFVCSAFMACGAQRLWRTRRTLLKVAVVGTSLLIPLYTAWLCAPWFRGEGWQRHRKSFGKRVMQVTEREAPLIFLSRLGESREDWYQHRTPEGEYLWHDPADFYLSHRKGWSLLSADATRDLVDTLRRRGAKYLAYYVADSWATLKEHPQLKTYLDATYVPLEVTPRWAIYRLQPNHHAAGPSSHQREPPGQHST